MKTLDPPVQAELETCLPGRSSPLGGPKSSRGKRWKQGCGAASHRPPAACRGPAVSHNPVVTDKALSVTRVKAHSPSVAPPRPCSRRST